MTYLVRFFFSFLHEIESSCCIYLLHLCQPLFFSPSPNRRSPSALGVPRHCTPSSTRTHTHTPSQHQHLGVIFFFFVSLYLVVAQRTFTITMICWHRDSSGTPTHKERPGLAGATHLSSVPHHGDQYLTAIHSMCGQQEGWGLRRRRPHHCCPLLLSHRSLSFLSFLPFLFPPRFVCHCSLFPSCHVED